MYIDHKAFGRPSAVADLPDDDALLLWSLRRLVVAWPRCHTVHAALHMRFGDAASGVEHLLRCLLVGIARHSRRGLTVGDPNCAVVLPDETDLLTAIRPGATRAAEAALARLTDDPGAMCLLPLAALLADQR